LLRLFYDELMKKLTHLFLLLVAMRAVPSFAQSTTVSGTVTDIGGQTWNNGTYSISFVPNPNYPVGPYTWTVGAFNTGATIAGLLSTSVTGTTNQIDVATGTTTPVVSLDAGTANCFGGASKVFNGIAYSNCYTGATLDVRVNACIIDAETGANGATSHICSSVGEPALLHTSRVGIVHQINVGDSSSDPVTWITPATCSWYVFLTGGTQSAISQHGNSKIWGGNHTNGCIVENSSVANGAKYLYKTNGAAYYQLDGISFFDRTGIGSTMASGIVFDIDSSYDNSTWQNFSVANYIPGTIGIQLGNSSPCCAGTIMNASIGGNFTGGIALYSNGSGGPQGVSLINVSLTHEAAGKALFSCTDTVTTTRTAMTWVNVYEELDSATTGDTTTVPNQINQCASINVHGLLITNGGGGALMTAPIFSIAAAKRSNPSSFHIDGLSATIGWTKSIVAVVNNNYAGKLANVAYTDANGQLTEYNSNQSYFDQITVAGCTGCAGLAGTAALGTSSIAAGDCASVVTVAASGALTTSDIAADFNADPTSTVGYQPGAMLTIVKYPTAGHVNFKVCNNTASTITPGAVTLNWRLLP
jgi:hypothetical protein